PGAAGSGATRRGAGGGWGAGASRPRGWAGREGAPILPTESWGPDVPIVRLFLLGRAAPAVAGGGRPLAGERHVMNRGYRLVALVLALGRGAGSPRRPGPRWRRTAPAPRTPPGRGSPHAPRSHARVPPPRRVPAPPPE